MQLLIVEVPGERASELAVLADEMTEDLRCRLIIRGLEQEDGSAAVLVSTWEDDVAGEVHAGLVMSGWPVRRYDEG